MKNLLFALTLFATSAVHAGLTDGLVAAYLLDGNADDASGHQQQGQVINASFTTDRFGQPQGAVHLDGRGDWVATPVDGQQHPLSLSFWFYLEARPGERHFAVISSSMADAFGHGFIIGSGPDHLNANMAANFSFEARRWTHGVVTYGNEIKVYLNGELKAAKPLPPDAGTPAGRFAIGRHSGSAAGHYFPGAIDDVLIYDRVLSAEEVKQLSEVGPALAAQLRAAEAARAQLARLTAEATAKDGQRAERPDGLSSTEGRLPIAITVSSVAEPGTNIWAMLDQDTNTAWTADHDATGWWMAAEYEDAQSISNLAVTARDNTAHGARWLTSVDGIDWQAWTPGQPASARWVVGLFPSDGETDQPPAISELLVR